MRNGEIGDEELNLVRSRVNAPFRTATLANLLAERQLEFAWEGWRRQDLIRFRQYTRTYTADLNFRVRRMVILRYFPFRKRFG